MPAIAAPPRIQALRHNLENNKVIPLGPVSIAPPSLGRRPRIGGDPSETLRQLLAHATEDLSASEPACSWNAALLTSTSRRHELAHHLPDRLLAKRAVLDVAGDDHAAAPLGLHVLLRVPRVPMLVEIDDADVGAFAREGAPRPRVRCPSRRRSRSPPCRRACRCRCSRVRESGARARGRLPGPASRGVAPAAARAGRARRPAPARHRRIRRRRGTGPGRADPACAGWRAASLRLRRRRARRGSWLWSLG